MSSMLTWMRGGPTTQMINLLIPDDGLYEQSETFSIQLSLVDPAEDADPASVGSLGNISQVVVTILGPNDGIYTWLAPVTAILVLMSTPGYL